MVRLGLLDASDDDEEFTTARSPYAAPTEADSEDSSPAAADGRRAELLAGGLFSRSDEAAGRSCRARATSAWPPSSISMPTPRPVAPRARAAAAPRRRAGGTGSS